MILETDMGERSQYGLTPEVLAVMTLGPLLNAIDRGHIDHDGDFDARALKQQIGVEFELRLKLHQQLRSENKADRRAARKIQKTGKNAWKLERDWTPPQHVEVGHWAGTRRHRDQGRHAGNSARVSA